MPLRLKGKAAWMGAEKSPNLKWSNCDFFLHFIICFHHKKLNVTYYESKSVKISPQEKCYSWQRQQLLSLWRCKHGNASGPHPALKCWGANGLLKTISITLACTTMVCLSDGPKPASSHSYFSLYLNSKFKLMLQMSLVSVSWIPWRLTESPCQQYYHF